MESVLGASLGELTVEVLRGAADAAIEEGQQLDFKQRRYEKTESKRLELAKDVCSFANGIGGVIVIGISESVGRSSSAEGIDSPSDGDRRWIIDAVSNRCHPVPEIEVLVVKDVGDDCGFIVVAVPPSRRAPHACSEVNSPSFRWPVRIGTQTRFMGEAEIADRYRSRRDAVEDDRVRAGQLVADARLKLGATDTWFIMSVVPSARPTAPPLDRERVRQLEEWWNRPGRAGATIGLYSYGEMVVSQRCLTQAGRRTSSGRSELNRLELHTDGSGVIAYQHPSDLTRVDAGQLVLADSHVAEFLVLGLGALAEYAVEVGGAWSDAAVHLEIHPGNQSRRNVEAFVGEWRYGSQLEQIRNSTGTENVITVGGTIPLSEVANDPIERVKAARLIGNEAMQAFGCAELEPLRVDGGLDLTRWPGTPSEIAWWAQGNGFVVDDPPRVALPKERELGEKPQPRPAG